MKTSNKLPQSLIAIIASIFLAFAPVSNGYIGTSTTGAEDTWTYPCGLASYYLYYYTFYGDYNAAGAFYSYYLGQGYYNFYTAENQQPTADFHLYNGLSLYYFYLSLDSGDNASAFGYYYTYQAYAFYYFYAGSGDVATANTFFNYYITQANAYFSS